MSDYDDDYEYADDTVEGEVVEIELKRPARKTAAKKAPAKRSRIPEHPPQPQDRKPRQQSRARRAEAEDEDAVFDCCGVEVIVPRDQADWSVEALEKFAEGNHVLGLRELVGAQTWQAIKDAGAKRRDLDDLSRDMQEELGVEGN